MTPDDPRASARHGRHSFATGWRLALAATQGTIIDMAAEMTKLTYDVISRTVFSTELATSAEVVQRFRSRLAADAKVEPAAWITLRPANSLLMRLEPRP